MTNLSTVPYAYEPGLIARLLEAVLETAHTYGGEVTAKMNVCVRLLYLSILQSARSKIRWRGGLSGSDWDKFQVFVVGTDPKRNGL